MTKNERIAELERKVRELETRETDRLFGRLTEPYRPVYPVCPQPRYFGWPYYTWCGGDYADSHTTYTITNVTNESDS